MTPVPTSTATTGRLPRAERRAQLLRVAAAAFLEAGFDKTSVEDVARAAGVTRLIVYRIFETKERLYREVLAEVIEELHQAFVGPGGAERLAAVGAAELLVGIARRHPDAFRLLWRHAAHEPEFAALASVFREGVGAYAEQQLEPLLGDAELRRWAAAALTSYLYDGVCHWLDQHPAGARDGELVALLRAGSRALVAAFSDR